MLFLEWKLYILFLAFNSSILDFNDIGNIKFWLQPNIYIKISSLKVFCVIIPPTQGWTVMPLDPNSRLFIKRKQKSPKILLDLRNLSVFCNLIYISKLPLFVPFLWVIFKSLWDQQGILICKVYLEKKIPQLSSSNPPSEIIKVIPITCVGYFI